MLAAAQGTTLETHLLHAAGMPSAAAQAIEHVAQTLAKLHQDPHLRFARQHTHADEVADIQRTGIYLREACPTHSAVIDALIKRITTQMQPCALAPAHRDLKPDHLFLDSAGLTFIDVDSCAMADPVADIALLMARLLAAPHTHAAAPVTANIMAATLREVYFAHVPTSWRNRLPPALASALLNVASSVCRRAEPNWANTSSTLLDKANHTLTTLELA